MPDNRSDQPKLERRYVAGPISAVHVEARADEATRLEGYAAIFYDGTPETEFQIWDDMVERIMPGAFDRAIAEDDVRALFNHDASAILGRTTADTLTLTVDARGLKYVNEPPDTSVGRDTLASVQRGDVTGSSFSFEATDVRWRTEDDLEIREILGVRLYDVGPVTFPAYEATTSVARSEQATRKADLEAERAEASRSERDRIVKRNRARVVELDLTRMESGG